MVPDELLQTTSKARRTASWRSYAAFQNTPIDTQRANWLVLSVAPDERISLQFEVKRSRPAVNLAAVKMDFHYDDWFPILADVDGALVTRDKVLTEAAKAAVRELDQVGIAFAITSGGPPQGMSTLIEPLGLWTAIAGFNGGELVNPDLSVIESRTLDPAAAK